MRDWIRWVMSPQPVRGHPSPHWLAFLYYVTEANPPWLVRLPNRDREEKPASLSMQSNN